MKKYLVVILAAWVSTALAGEVPLCPLPQASPMGVEANYDPSCSSILTSAQKTAKNSPVNFSWVNAATIPPQLSVGVVYLQPITMAPAGMMLPRSKSDIHLEMDIHAKANLKSRGFTVGDWLPNAEVDYSIQKVGDPKFSATGRLMGMVADDGAHYGDNVKLGGPGFYIVTFDAHTDPHFGWHTDTDSKILGTEFVDWRFKQSYLMKWTGVGKLGGY